MISGEYFVLDGALALAIPTLRGQEMQVTRNPDPAPVLSWRSLDHEGKTWFEARYLLPELQLLTTQDQATGLRLQSILQAIGRQNPAFWHTAESLTVLTRLDFPRAWGLGTSSTLVVNLARWSQTDPFRLLQDTFTGSGYDIACGLAENPLLYQLRNGKPNFVELPFRPPYSKGLYFIYLGNKQDSRAGINHDRQKAPHPPSLLKQISALSLAMVQARQLTEFAALVTRHEQLIGHALQLPQVKNLYFPDYWGAIKSLGAWGGDFIMATSDRTEEDTRRFFNEKGYSVVFAYNELLV